jgi:tetratricopeptide (TPR) repeat protein
MEAEAPERAEIAKKAIAAIDSSLVVKGEDPRYQQRKARILIVANNNEVPEEAVQVYNVILEQLNKDPENLEKYVNLYKESYQMIAGYYHKNKDFAKAVEYYEKMLELDPENEALKKYVDNLRKRI